MSVHIFTVAEKLERVERLIKDARWDKASSERDVDLLKAIALDLRARLDGAPSAALTRIENRMTAVKRRPNDNGSLRGVGEEVVALWPIVRQSIERFGAEIEEVQR